MRDTIAALHIWRLIFDLCSTVRKFENCITFWPKYGSKTDNGDYRQSGWKLHTNLETVSLDPVFWVKSLIRLSKTRRDECRLDNLFLTVCGPPKAASRTTIANWLKALLMEAGINATPGSFRPAVSSKNWIQNFPIDEILKRGNWRSQNVFMKYYKRSVLPDKQTTSITRLFSPV
ncbi:uncharacterized protein LOC126372889 [Pectinophora gossypiella]|uniref:uncharacterized protein LOC126372889 n=1 Tax=Pectinophora gossypiella TaxID=13191 RepID=UPI00214EC337|nr:uncharacterized protein LOC126372889 [Pectinophora gossypiella]